MLMANLLRSLDQPCSRQRRQSLLDILDRMSVSLPHHLQLVSRGGYFTKVIRLRPNWHRPEEALHGAKVDCITALPKVRDRVESVRATATSEIKESGDIDFWIRSLVSIRGHESRLLQAAFTLDIGGEA
jgi:hypothetical protein